MGDPAGIGPEVTVKALGDARVYDRCRPLVLGDVGTIERTVAGLGLAHAVRRVERPAEAHFQRGAIDVLQAVTDDLAGIALGQVQAAAGKAAVQCVLRGVELAQAREIDVIATAPLNKDAMNQAGYHYAGHTELLAELTGTETYALMLVAGSLRVVHVTTHVSMRRALDLLSQERVLRMIRLADKTVKELGIAAPRVAVSGFNCHAGENGLFGTEEQEHISPAIERARGECIDVSGPWPADTVFLRAADGGEFDIVVCMYHDQGHVAVKMRGLQEGVNTTAGLPIIRTSVDHGTAFDIAGKGIADHGSMVAAITLGAELAERRFYS
jgi:4-phospho-D-threonate 3-dehydrogenase / 4-phospho-D-erythronate 3-dehydrogenase